MYILTYVFIHVYIHRYIHKCMQNSYRHIWTSDNNMVVCTKNISEPYSDNRVSDKRMSLLCGISLWPLTTYQDSSLTGFMQVLYVKTLLEPRSRTSICQGCQQIPFSCPQGLHSRLQFTRSCDRLKKRKEKKEKNSR